MGNCCSGNNAAGERAPSSSDSPRQSASRASEDADTGENPEGGSPPQDAPPENAAPQADEAADLESEPVTAAQPTTKASTRRRQLETQAHSGVILQSTDLARDQETPGVRVDSVGAQSELASRRSKSRSPHVSRAAASCSQTAIFTNCTTQRGTFDEILFAAPVEMPLNQADHSVLFNPIAPVLLPGQAEYSPVTCSTGGLSFGGNRFPMFFPGEESVLPSPKPVEKKEQDKVVIDYVPTPTVRQVRCGPKTVDVCELIYMTCRNDDKCYFSNNPDVFQDKLKTTPLEGCMGYRPKKENVV